MRIVHTLGAAALLMATAAVAADRTERVRFAAGTSQAALRGVVGGYDSVNYIVGARAGQHMMVNFNSRIAYFNVWAPGADSALFIGSSAGNSFSGNLPATGEYRVQVYLMRNEARRGARAPYSLTIAVH